MDIEDLRSFVEITRRGSFSEAARVLSVSQPAVSRRIRNLERHLGSQLFDRSGSVVTPTRHGLSFLTFAEEVLQDYNSLRQSLTTAAGGQDTLHIAASTTPGEYLLPDLLATFARRHPEIKASLHVMDSATVAECVEARHCDLGFLGRPPRHNHLSRWQVVEDEIVLAVPAAHPWAGRAEVALAELAGQPFIERTAGSGTRATVAAALQERGRRLPPRLVVMETDSVQSQMRAIAGGHGIGFVSRLALGHYGWDHVAALRLTGLAVRRGLFMIWADHPTPARRARAALDTFVAFVQAAGGQADR